METRCRWIPRRHEACKPSTRGNYNMDIGECMPSPCRPAAMYFVYCENLIHAGMGWCLIFCLLGIPAQSPISNCIPIVQLNQNYTYMPTTLDPFVVRVCITW